MGSGGSSEDEGPSLGWLGRRQRMRTMRRTSERQATMSPTGPVRTEGSHGSMHLRVSSFLLVVLAWVTQVEQAFILASPSAPMCLSWQVVSQLVAQAWHAVDAMPPICGHTEAHVLKAQSPKQVMYAVYPVVNCTESPVFWLEGFRSFLSCAPVREPQLEMMPAQAMLSFYGSRQTT